MERDKALDMALGQIEKQFGKGSVMRMGETASMDVESISTGALALDLALGIGGLPRGRIVEIYGPESSGKCLTADTWLWTDRGLETVAEVFSRCGQPATCTTRITAVGEIGLRAVNENGELEAVAALTHNDLRPVLRLRVGSGREITVTHNHPLRVVDERGSAVWREAGRIRVGDELVSAAFGAVEAAGGDGLSEDEAVLLGYLVGGGMLDDPVSIRCAGSGPDGADEPARLVEQLFGAAVSVEGGELAVVDSALRSQLADHYGLAPVGEAGKTVPPCVRTAGHKAQRAFLSALFEAAAPDDADRIGLATGSEELARQVQLMLYALGVLCTIRPSPAPLEDQRWSLAVDPGSIHRFLDEIGFRSPLRHGPAGTRSRRAGHRYTREAVVSVEDAGMQPTFDLVLPTTHSFLANGVLSHNTTLAMHVVAEAQRNGGICAYIDAEHAVDPVYAGAIGVNVDELLISQPDTGEQALEIADMLIRSGALDVLVVDSVAALTPRAEIEGDMGDAHVGLQARLMSQALRKITATLSRSNTIAIFINQLREKIGVFYGPSEVTPGGRALKFYSSVRLDIRRIESIKDGVEVVGNRTRVKVAKNKCGAPFKTCEFDIGFGKGISREGSLIDVGVDLGIVKKSGAWYTYEGEQLGQGRENAKVFLIENPEIMVEISERIRTKVGIGAPPPGTGPGTGDGTPVAANGPVAASAMVANGQAAVAAD